MNSEIIERADSLEL